MSNTVLGALATLKKDYFFTLLFFFHEYVACMYVTNAIIIITLVGRLLYYPVDKSKTQ